MPISILRPSFKTVVAAIALPVICLAGINAAIPSPGHAADISSTLNQELGEILRGTGYRPNLRWDLQRPIDPRLVRIQTYGIEGSGLFRGKKYLVHNAREIESLSMRLAPGDQLVLVGNDWQDAKITFGGRGTPEAPILVCADEAAAPFAGASQITFYGEHLIISRLAFKGGIIDRSMAINEADEPPNPNGPAYGFLHDVVRLGADRDRPASHCIIDQLTIENVNSPGPEDWPRVITRYLLVNGHDNTVARSTFAHLRNYGEIIATGESPSAIPQRLHILDNRFIDRPRVDQEPCPYRHKIIQLGWGKLKAAPAGSLIQGNHFEDCASQVELVSIKVSDVFVRDNRFVRCRGAVNIRTGDRVLIQRNVFSGEDLPGTGGLRVAGCDHVIAGNIFSRLHPDEYSQMWPPPKPPTRFLAWTLSLVAADAEYSGTRNNFDEGAFGRVTNILITHNRFEQNTGRIALGSPTPSRSERLYLPRRIRLEHNTFGGDEKGTELFDYVAPDPTASLGREVFSYNNQFR